GNRPPAGMRDPSAGSLAIDTSQPDAHRIPTSEGRAAPGDRRPRRPNDRSARRRRPSLSIAAGGGWRGNARPGAAAVSGAPPDASATRACPLEGGGPWPFWRPARSLDISKGPYL